MKQVNGVRHTGVRISNVQTKRDGFVLKISDLRIPPGKTVCIVGPNGGGKTTLLLTLLGLLPHTGSCLINGREYDGVSADIKSTIGFVPDDPELLFEELTAWEQWELTTSVLDQVRGVPMQTSFERANELARQLSFEPPSLVASQYSHGMRKKTQLVNALLGMPSVIVIDELRNGLDPIAIRQSEELIKSEQKRGAAVIAATHDLWWAERFADYIYIINSGSIVAQGTPKSLLKPDESHLEQAFLRIVKDNHAVA